MSDVLVVAEQLRDTVPGGIGTYVRGLVQGLQSLHPPVIDPTLWASRAPRRRPDAVADLGLPVLTSRLSHRLLLGAWARGRARPPAEFALVHATSLAVPATAGAPMTAMVHDLGWREMPEAYPRHGRRWHEAALSRALTRAALLIVPSRRTADALVAAGAPAARVAVVEEGGDHLPPADLVGAEALLAGAGVTGEFLLTVSTLEPRKNLPRLLEAYSSARPRLPEPWPLVVAGPVGWGERLRPVPGAVLLGAVEGAVLAGLYRRARMLAYVPLVEGFGLPPLEAMHACTPVVASPLPSTGGAAREVDPHDVGAIADQLVAVASDEALRSGLVSMGLERAGELTWRAAATRHAELWASL